MKKPDTIIINSYTAANSTVDEKLIAATAEQLLHIKLEHSFLNMYPGCVVLGSPVFDVQNKRITIHLGYTEWRVEESSHCYECNGGRINIREWGEKTVKDCCIGPFTVILKIKVPKIVCNDCGKQRWLKPEFIHPHHRITMRLYGTIVQLLDIGESHIDLKKIGEITGVEADIIRKIDKARLIEMFKDIRLDNVKNIAIDEISIKKHHRYITVVIDADARRLLYAAYGRKKEDLKPFFERLKELNLLDKIEGAVMDGNCGYQNIVKEFCPNAKIILDLFHCLQMYNRDVADKVRLNMVKKLQAKLNEMPKEEREANKKPFYKKISDLKQSKWLTYMGMNKVNTQSEAKQELVANIKENEELLQVAIFGDHVRELWHKGRSPAEVRTELENLCSKANATGISQLIDFFNKLKGWAEFIVHAATTGLNTSILEGCNAKFKTIKRVAYGFRDLGYFILKLHQSLAHDRESTLVKAVLI